MALKVGDLFSGYGGLGIATAAALDGTVVWHAENDPAPSRILAHRWPATPNLGDVTRIDWTTVPAVDVLAGGFPCQDLSPAGLRRGLRPGTRSGLWTHFAYAIDRLRPETVVIENVRGLLSAAAHSDVEPCTWCVGDRPDEPTLRALGAVLGDLADLGYDAAWTGVRAADVGAPHGRFRVFVVATDTGGEAVNVGGGPRQGGRPQSGGDDLTTTVHRLLPTPMSTDAKGANTNLVSWENARKSRGEGGASTLPAVAHLLPTPTATDARASGGVKPGNVTLTDATVRTSLGVRTNPRYADGNGSSGDQHPPPPSEDDPGLF